MLRGILWLWIALSTSFPSLGTEAPSRYTQIAVDSTFELIPEKRKLTPEFLGLLQRLFPAVVVKVSSAGNSILPKGNMDELRKFIPAFRRLDAPIAAVEILVPRDTPLLYLEKVQEYFPMAKISSTSIQLEGCPAEALIVEELLSKGVIGKNSI